MATSFQRVLFSTSNQMSPVIAADPNARLLGRDTEEISAGLYERASIVELVRYGEIVLADLQQQAWVLVNAAHVESSVPATHRRLFSVDDDATVLAPIDLARGSGTTADVVVLGAGETAMDVVCWLTEQGMEPDRLQWVCPRDCCLLDYQSRSAEACAQAKSGAKLARQLESHGMFCQIDQRTEPQAHGGATICHAEFETVRTVEGVIRSGHVQSVAPGEMRMGKGHLLFRGTRTMSTAPLRVWRRRSRSNLLE